MKRIIIALCALLFVSASAVGSPLPKYSERNFVVDMACKSEKVCILSMDANRTWRTQALNLQNKTGVQVALIVVHGTGSLPLEQYANDAANALKVGTKGNGGVVFLFDNKERKARLEVSRDLEGTIPDATAKEIVVLFSETLAESSKKLEGDPLGKSLGIVFERVDHYVTEEHAKKGGKAFVAEKDKSFTYFALVCATIVLIFSFVAVLMYSKRWYYTNGSLISAALCTFATLLFPTLTLSKLLIFILAFIVTYIFAWIWHRAGDSAGWDIVDSIPTGGASEAAGSMAEGVADFAGGGASEAVGSAVKGVADIASNAAGSCSMPDISGCDLSGCGDIGGCDF